MHGVTGKAELRQSQAKDFMTASENTDSAPDDVTIAIMALGWILADERRADRLLSLTGLTPDQLREGAGNPHVLSEVLRFLESHEPDLVAAADHLNIRPEKLVSVRRSIAV